jgi:hypothetical protein
MNGSCKDNSANGGGDRGDFSQLKAIVIMMILGWGVTVVARGRFHIELGDYLGQRKAMFLANAYLRLFHFFADRQSFICAADRFNC